MKPITTEIIIPIGEDYHAIYSKNRVKIRIYDEGAGPYLMVEGINDEPAKEFGQNTHQFYLCSEKEIEEFAAICKDMLEQGGEK